MSDSLPEWILDAKTPAEVEVTGVLRTPVEDSRLGVDRYCYRGRYPTSPSVAIEDPLTHGFQSGAIYNIDVSYPAIIAHEMGWYVHFRQQPADNLSPESAPPARVAR
jgi:hypothetical protein